MTLCKMSDVVANAVDDTEDSMCKKPAGAVVLQNARSGLAADGADTAIVYGPYRLQICSQWFWGADPDELNYSADNALV